ncbi:MAG: coproporphyrinogen III oxidase [Hyphomicrobiaceae bacterium]|nr:coproporphyrinogen III oxidase [Hyphomicrobiaceae bacterium]
MSIVNEPGFGVYVHWPFCAQKCPYCDFNSHVRFKPTDDARYLAAYRRELDSVAAITGRGQSVSSIFLGGGTPSLMQPSTVAGILEHIARLWSIAPGAEITLEANPGSVEAGRFAGYRAAGVNRVSLGVQSLRDAELRRLGRIHSVDEAKAAIAIARRTFERYSFDLIYARPGQSAHDWRDELGEALALAGDHLSLYQLTIEPDTPFASLHKAGKLVTPDPEAARALYDITQDITQAHGLPAYEISNHARPGEESRHNLLYWRYGAYAGVGAGAHGRLVRASDGVRLATSTLRSPEAWLAAVEAGGHGFNDLVELSAAEVADEMLLMGLRIGEGLDLRRLAELTGHAPSADALARLEAAGLIAPRGPEGRLRTTRDGSLVLDWVVSELSSSFAKLNGGRTAPALSPA